jgi:hypothetical protein
MAARSYVRKLAQGWLVLGAIGLAFTTAFAVGHYLFGIPVHEGHTQGMADPKSIAQMLVMLFLGSCLFGGLGGWILFRYFRK